jgi:hypothetical protein
MALRLQDIGLGVVAYFDDKLLLAEKSIDNGGSNLNRPGPFVCVQMKDGASAWCPITGEFRPERLPLKKQWRRFGSDKWKEDDQYLNDGLNTFVGPNEAFVRAGAKEVPFTQYRRPRVSADGVAAMLEEVRKQGGLLL